MKDREADTKSFGGDNAAEVGLSTERRKISEVTDPSDLQIVKDRDNHEHDMEYRRVQLQLAQRVIYGVSAFAVVAFFTGVLMSNNVVMQTGLTLASTILGVVLTFLFPKS